MATINDLVLVHVDNLPGFYARIDDITPDIKKGWWQVKLLVLTFPLQVYTWTLDESQIDGAPYTMGGTPLRIEKIESPTVREEPKVIETPEISAKKESGSRPKVVSLMDRNKGKKG